ncbi:MAG: hypothetical protein Q9184_007538, partial [Pyrenodesmia sp. 2 TL-2023]
ILDATNLLYQLHEPVERLLNRFSPLFVPGSFSSGAPTGHDQILRLCPILVTVSARYWGFNGNQQFDPNIVHGRPTHHTALKSFLPDRHGIRRAILRGMYLVLRDILTVATPASLALSRKIPDLS